MKQPWIWIVVLVAVAMAAYALNRGVYVGSKIIQTGTNPWDPPAGPYLYRDCWYLFPSGVITSRQGGWGLNQTQEAENSFCTLFHDTN